MDKKDLNQTNETVPFFGKTQFSDYKKTSLISVLVFTIGLVAFCVYSYVTMMSSYSKTAESKTEMAASSTSSSSPESTDDLMRKMKQMLDEEKNRDNTPKQESVVESNTTSEHNESIQAHVSVEQNQSAVKTDSQGVVANVEEPKVPKEISEAHEYQESMKEAKQKPSNGSSSKGYDLIRKKYPPGTTPKLAIVIDDVSFAWQTKSIKEIPYKVTPAFFPPTKGHPDTVKLSHEFEAKMIHLPMESKFYSSPEEDTLNTTDSYEVIERRIKRIKEWFPEIIYYNNHTGGTFTADYDAMDKLIRIMKEQGLSFVDSRTIGNSKAATICNKYGMFLYSRDVFLDNSLDKTIIREQLKHAVEKAKKQGSAIAIGHPHKNTLEVLKNSADLMVGVDVVYLKDL